MTDHFEPLIPHEPDNGFPSDHTLLGGAIASLLLPFEKRLSAGAWILTVVFGLCRVYAGQAYTTPSMFWAAWQLQR